MTVHILSALWFVSAGVLIYGGWNYWLANAVVVGALASVALAWFHVRVIGGSARSLSRVIWVDLAPMSAAAWVLVWLSPLPLALNAAALVFSGVVFVIAGITVRQLWQRYPNYQAVLHEGVRAFVLSAFGYPVWHFACDGSFFVPAALSLGLACFVGFAIKSGWDACLLPAWRDAS
jgi:hypothetical protein